VGVDTGGTFTDLVVGARPGSRAPGPAGEPLPGTIVKVPSTPGAPAVAVRAAVDAVTGAARRPALLAHGTTVATNALLERRVARVGLLTTRGFADVIEIARQARPSLYDQRVDRPPPLVPRALRFEVAGRLDAQGAEIEPFDGRLPDAFVEAVTRDRVDAVAVCLLHADLEPAHELAVLRALEQLGAELGRRIRARASHQVSPELREYERTVTTVVDAALAPVCSDYLRAVRPLADSVVVMTSAGGLVPADTAATHPASLLVSGPAAGVRAAAAVTTACGLHDAVSFDMGGTSTDVCLVRGGVPEPAATHHVGGYPIRLPSLAVHTIGAGGGSVARIDAGGALAVGPDSAGARPGPACYGLGGSEPTVTDADLVLGRIPADATFAGLPPLDVHAARAALAQLGFTTPDDAARAVVAVVDAAMERAVRAVTVESGVDPRRVALVAFGGAGPLHACAVADALAVPSVVVPARAGVFSAVGLLCSPREREVVRSWGDRGDPRRARTARDVDRALAALRTRAETLVLAGVGDGPVPEVSTDVFLDCRYRGQSHELVVSHRPSGGPGAGLPAWEWFHSAHESRNGFARPDVPVEVIALRARSRLPTSFDVRDLPTVDRLRVVGPRVVSEPDCTVWVPEGWTAEPAPTGAWILSRDV
jgi:N-methylhydantoinase A/oxoprolinase/acetone carboxylase beta subunit